PIESTSPLSAGENVDGATLPAALVPSEPIAPDRAFEEQEVRDRIRAAIASLPPRERRVIGLYYYGEATMKQIGAEIGVDECRVSALLARPRRSAPPFCHSRARCANCGWRRPTCRINPVSSCSTARRSLNL